MSDSLEQMIRAFVDYLIEADGYNNWWMDNWLYDNMRSFLESYDSSTGSKIE